MSRDHDRPSHMEFFYDKKTHVLTVYFKDNTVSRYKNVPEEIYKQIIRAPSKGTYFNFHVRDKYERV